MKIDGKQLRDWIGAGLVAVVIGKLVDLIVDRVQALEWKEVALKFLFDPTAHVFMAMLGVPLVLFAVYAKRYKIVFADFEFLAQLWFTGMGAGFLGAMMVHFIRGTTAPIVHSLESDPIGTSVLLAITIMYMLAPIIRVLLGLPTFVPSMQRTKPKLE
jgi:hypothetical protein